MCRLMCRGGRRLNLIAMSILFASLSRLLGKDRDRVIHSISPWRERGQEAWAEAEERRCLHGLRPAVACMPLRI